jgi:hypothetical protein
MTISSRYGGDLSMMLRDVDVRSASTPAERLREQGAAANIAHAGIADAPFSGLTIRASSGIIHMRPIAIGIR